MKQKSDAFLLPVKQFSSAVAASKPDEAVWIHYAPFGRWSHPDYGVTYMTVDKANKMVQNFHEKVRGIDLMTDYEHGVDPAKGTKASGQIMDMKVNPDGVWAAVNFTETARTEIGKGEWKYFSPTFYENWTNPMTDKKHEAVAAGGGLTNKPWIKGMVPLNFSEVVVGSDDDMLHYKIDGEVLYVSTSVKDGEREWRVATTGEVREWEHSEPGTGTPPNPNYDEDDRSGDNGTGSRRDSPPPAYEDDNNNSVEGGSKVKLSKDAAEALGLTLDDKGEIDDTKVESGVLAMFSELKPLKEAEAAKSREKAFSEAFPVEFAELTLQRSNRLTEEAKKFSEDFSRLTVGEGDDVKKSTRGLSAIALEKIADTHKAFSEGDTEKGLKAFSEALGIITSDKGIVDYGEAGSGRVVAGEGSDPATGAADIAKAFSEAAKTIQAEEGGPSKCSWGDAVSKAATKHPELAKQYSELRRGGE